MISSLETVSQAHSPFIQLLREYGVSQLYGDRGIRSENALQLVYDLLSVWTKGINANYLYVQYWIA